MYTIAFGRDAYSPWRLRKSQCVVLRVLSGKDEVVSRRETSGDLVFDESGAIVQDDWWLFDYEKQDSDSYARRAQRAYVFLSDFD